MFLGIIIVLDHFHMWSQVLGLFITEEDVRWFKTF